MSEAAVESLKAEKTQRGEELRTLKAEQEIAARQREERGEEPARGRGGEAREDREEEERLLAQCHEDASRPHEVGHPAIAFLSRSPSAYT